MTATAVLPELANAVHYNTIRLRDVDVFYREAGPNTAPVVLLLHGFPTSFNMFRNLIPQLAKSFRVVAPDYPGYGFSGMPDRKDFAYTFENMTSIVEELTMKLGLAKYSLYVMDYGAPIGYRLAIRHPEKITGLIVQNGNAYDEGLLAFWDPIKKYWVEPTAENRAALEFLVKPEATKWQYQNGVADTSHLDPTTWTLDQAGMTVLETPTSSSTCCMTTAPTCLFIRSFRNSSANTSRPPSLPGGRMTTSSLPRVRSRINGIFPRSRRIFSIRGILLWRLMAMRLRRSLRRSSGIGADNRRMRIVSRRTAFATWMV
jgi:alpha/beta hydrolase fold